MHTKGNGEHGDLVDVFTADFNGKISNKEYEELNDFNSSNENSGYSWGFWYAVTTSSWSE